MIAVPPPSLRTAPKGEAEYVASGRKTLADLTRAGLKPGHSVLDIGCGSGRVAAHLADFLTGRYVGIDIDEGRVAWCRENIAPGREGFEFLHLDASNAYYRKTGSELAATRLPVRAASIDFCIVNSVFSHLAPADCAHTLGEIARVLKPGGTLWCSWFLLTDKARRMIGEGRSRFRFVVGEGPDFYETEDRSLAAVAYDPGFVVETIAESALDVVDIDYGSWSGMARTGDIVSIAQDVIICRAPA